MFQRKRVTQQIFHSYEPFDDNKEVGNKHIKELTERRVYQIKSIKSSLPNPL